MADAGVYVVAFVDARMPRRTIQGRIYRSIGRGSLWAIGEARTVAPLLTDDELKRQYAVVNTIWRACAATLPVRFGAMLTVRLVEAALTRHQAVLEQGLATVRSKAQMTVRFLGERSTPPAQPAEVTSGRDYLEQRRAAARPIVPPSATAWLARLERLASAKRLEPGAGSLLATAYHLVPNEALDAYREQAAGAEDAGAVVTGPSAPFAFTPAII